MKKVITYIVVVGFLFSSLALYGQLKQPTISTAKMQQLSNPTGYFDDFSLGDRVDNWPTKTGYTFSWDESNKWLKLQMSSNQWNRNAMLLRDAANNVQLLDLTGFPYVRFRVYANKQVLNNNMCLTDVNNKQNNHWANSIQNFALDGEKWQEFFMDYTGKLYYDNKVNNIDIANVKSIYFAMNDGLTDALIYIDDFRVGTEAVLNIKPTVNEIAKPDYILVGSGAQTIQVTGIDDGNPERNEMVSVTATSNNQNIVADNDIQVIYNGGSTATINYKPVSGKSGIAVISVLVKDDHGIVYTGEEDSQKVSFSVEVRDPAINNAPICGIITSKIYSGRGQQILVLPNINDGDNDKLQNVSISAISKDLTKLTIDSVVYNPLDQEAFIYVKDNFKLGPVDIEITLKDDGGTIGNDTYINTQTVNVRSFKNPCANFVQYDIAQWQPRPVQTDIPTTNSYVKICQSNTPIESLERDFFWSKMYGYIVPSVTDYYMFQGYSNEGFYFYINLNDGISTDPTKLTTMCEDEFSPWISSSTLLEAGKVYYFEAYSRDIVNIQPFWIKWTSSSMPLSFIADDNLAPDFDITKPTTPGNFRISNLGVNDITFSWNNSTDNAKVLGYNLFVNGVVVNDTLITGTEYKVTGLKENTAYSCFAVSVDKADNYSLPTKVINVNTYLVDLIAPPTPINLTSDFATSFGVKLRWHSVVDGQTQVRGYNIYQDNVLIKENYNDTTVLVGKLSERTNYEFRVSSVDANYNESSKSAPYSVSTVAFDPNETRDEVRKGRLSVNLKPLCKFNGIGLGASYGRSGMLGSNLISYGGFESAQLDTMTAANMSSYYQKAISSASFKRAVHSVTYPCPDGGTYCGNISMLAGGYFRCLVGAQFNKKYTYLLRFKMRKHVAYKGDIQIKLTGRFAGAFISQTVTPTDTWTQYELELNTDYEGIEGTWYLDFVSKTSGDVYIDNLQLINKACYIPGSPYSSKGLELLREFKPSAIRWGGIYANVGSFKYCTGKAEGTFSYGDWVNLANTLGAKSYIVTGMTANSDYRTDSKTFKKLVEYFAGDASTAGGAIRNAEGYTELVSKSKGIFIELGNEVWGGANHYAPIGSDYAAYGGWARSVAKVMKSTAGYDSNKFSIAYSGRMPGENYGLHKLLLTGDAGEVDVLATSGYMGGNLNLDPKIPIGTSQLDYHKNSIAVMQRYLTGLGNDQREMLLTAGRLLPMYMYEGNMTQDSYFGRLGQAVTFSDYYTTVPLYGVPDVCIYNMEGGQWRLIQDEISFKKTPLFYLGKYINNYCTGTMLETKFTTASKIYDYTNPLRPVALTIDPVGCKAYTDSTSYSVAMFSRDFENDYVVQVDVPDNVSSTSKCKLITITGASYSSEDIVVDEKEILNFSDSIQVKVPKYGVTILRFDGIDQHYSVPSYYSSIKLAESIKLTSATGINAITKNRGRLTINLAISPSDAFLQSAKWKLVDNEKIGAYFVEGTSSITLYSTGTCAGNGTVKVVACTADGSQLSDTLSINISNQGSGCSPQAIDEVESKQIGLYPIPAQDYLRVTVPDGESGRLTVVDLNGKVLSSQNTNGNESMINIAQLKKGVYMIRVELNDGVKIMKFIKM